MQKSKVQVKRQKYQACSVWKLFTFELNFWLLTFYLIKRYSIILGFLVWGARWYSVSSGERKRSSLNHCRKTTGFRDRTRSFFPVGKRFGRGDHREWKSRIWNRNNLSAITKVPRSTATLWEAPAGPPAKAKYFQWPIVNKYREGTVKSTPEGEWNSTWNHLLTSR